MPSLRTLEVKQVPIASLKGRNEGEEQSPSRRVGPHNAIASACDAEGGSGGPARSEGEYRCPRGGEIFVTPFLRFKRVEVGVRPWRAISPPPKRGKRKGGRRSNSFPFPRARRLFPACGKRQLVRRKGRRIREFLRDAQNRGKKGRAFLPERACWPDVCFLGKRRRHKPACIRKGKRKEET